MMDGTKKLSLFDIVTDEAKRIEETIDALEEQGLPYDEAVAKAIENAESLTKEKVIDYACLIRKWETQAAEIEATAAVLQVEMQKRMKVAQSRRNKAQRLRDRILELAPKDIRYEDERAAVSFRPYPQVKVSDVVSLNRDFVRHVVTIIPDGTQPVYLGTEDHKASLDAQALQAALRGSGFSARVSTDFDMAAIRAEIEQKKKNIVQSFVDSGKSKPSSDYILSSLNIPGVAIDPNWKLNIK